MVNKWGGVFLLFSEVPWSQHSSVPDTTWPLGFLLPLVMRFQKPSCIRVAITSVTTSLLWRGFPFQTDITSLPNLGEPGPCLCCPIYLRERADMNIMSCFLRHDLILSSLFTPMLQMKQLRLRDILTCVQSYRAGNSKTGIWGQAVCTMLVTLQIILNRHWMSASCRTHKC